MTSSMNKKKNVVHSCVCQCRLCVLARQTAVKKAEKSVIIKDKNKI